ncbi:hypothetical protein SDC9_208475 [bioreactor metagenome]|uniref:Uncharacterized protein n=1 Tax=bioreactor metagenome TaxID=1076179 RepID=A0A645JMA3_9ZZZZ
MANQQIGALIKRLGDMELFYAAARSADHVAFDAANDGRPVISLHQAGSYQPHDARVIGFIKCGQNIKFWFRAKVIFCHSPHFFGHLLPLRILVIQLLRQHGCILQGFSH